MSEGTPVVQVDRLSIEYTRGLDTISAVNEVSFTIGRGERVAIIGESGSGKSTTAHALLGLLPGNARITGGAIEFGGADLTRLRTERSWRPFRGRRIALVPQDPNIALNPVKKVGAQIEETLRLHRGLRGGAARSEAIALIERVGLRDTAHVLRAYPHELSGGMRQRVLVAIAISSNPDLIIADEPTSGLDVTLQKLVLDILEELCASTSTSLLLITHDLAVAQQRSDRIVVLRRGKVVDQDDSARLVASTSVAYTRALFAAVPSYHAGRLRSSHGPRQESSPVSTQDAIVRVDHVVKTYRRRLGGFASEEFRAVDDVSLEVRRGSTFGIVGESGSGKSTLMRLIAGFERPTDGSIEVSGLRDGGRVQYVFQNPYSSLDPRLRIEDIVAEPLEVGSRISRTVRRARAREVLELVGLDPSHARRRPPELSGGQRQRVAIARALIADPPLIILDEPVSALDVSVQAQVLQLLVDLQAELGLTYLFVTHDLSVVRLVADDLAVVDQGRIVEHGTVAAVLNDPRHPKTRELVSAIPLLNFTA